MLELGGAAALTPQALAEAARVGSAVTLHAQAWARIEAGHAAVLRVAASGEKIYGLTTGLGAVVDTAVGAHDPARERRVVLARAVGTGAPATAVEVRAIMIARLAGFARGVSGVSAPTVRAYLGLLASGEVPHVPLTGSLGEADLAPLAHVAAALGDAPLGPKDGLALVSSNAVSTGLAALALADARHALGVLTEAAALSIEAQGANPALLRADLVGLYPAPGRAEIAAALRALLAGGALAEAGQGRRLHDPLSFRCIVPVLGALQAAIEAADAAVSLALASSDDNPAVLGEAMFGTANFDTTHLALGFEALGQAMSRAAAMTGARVMQLMRAETTGLPRFLTPREAGGRSGLAPLQKTVAGLVAEIAHAALPLPAVVLAVADGLEDVATMAVPVVRKTAAIARLLATLAAAEMITAAQAVDLRAGLALGVGTSRLHAAIRAVVPMLDEDRSVAGDLEALATSHEPGVGER